MCGRILLICLIILGILKGNEFFCPSKALSQKKASPVSRPKKAAPPVMGSFLFFWVMPSYQLFTTSNLYWKMTISVDEEW